MIGPGLLRLLLALVVVVHHSSPLRLGTWPVFLFFAISGYWIASKSETLPLRLTTLGSFWFGRWWRLAPVFLVCTILALGATYMGLSLSERPEHPLGWFIRQIPILGATSSGRLLPVTWTLEAEMQFICGRPVSVRHLAEDSGGCRRPSS